MRYFRFMAITVLLLACVVLGSACAGAKGEPGEKGADGVGVENIVNNGNGTFTVNLTNGAKYTTDNLTGPQGENGEVGPNMIVAMAVIDDDGTGPIIRTNYNVNSCVWHSTYHQYWIQLTGMTFYHRNYVVQVTPQVTPLMDACRVCYYDSPELGLVVWLIDDAGTSVQGGFSFVVLKSP